MNARFTPAIIYSEAFLATNWADADFRLDNLANRPQSVPCRLHVHNGNAAAQDLVLVTKGGIRSTYSCPPGAFPYPIDIRAQKIGFGSGADLTVTADYTHDGITADFISHPSQVEGLVAWYGDTVTGAGTAGFNVRDLSGNGNHGTQAVTGNQPTSSGGLLNFAAASSQHFDVASAPLGLSGASKFAFVFRATCTEDIPTTTRKLLTNQAENALVYVLNTTSGAVTFSHPGAGAQRLTLDGADIAATSEFALTFTFDAGLATARVNGTQTDQVTLGITALPTFSDAINIGGVNLNWDGSMRNVFIVSGRIPTEAELQYLENYGV